MKRQEFDILHYELENSTKALKVGASTCWGCRTCMTFCTEQWIEDIEAMELPQIQAFREIPSNRLTESKRPGIITSAEERCSCKRKSTGTPMYGIWSGSTYSQSGWIPQTLC